MDIESLPDNMNGIFIEIKASRCTEERDQNSQDRLLDFPGLAHHSVGVKVTCLFIIKYLVVDVIGYGVEEKNLGDVECRRVHYMFRWRRLVFMIN